MMMWTNTYIISDTQVYDSVMADVMKEIAERKEYFKEYYFIFSHIPHVNEYTTEETKSLCFLFSICMCMECVNTTLVIKV